MRNAWEESSGREWLFEYLCGNQGMGMDGAGPERWAGLFNFPFDAL